MARENWVDLTTIDNNTAIFNIAWLGDSGFSTINDTWFSEKSGLITDSAVEQPNGWSSGKTADKGYYTYHRMSNNYKKYSCTFLDQYYTGNGSTVEYGVAMTDALINQLPTGTINGQTYYMLNIVDWQNWKPLYMPLSTSKIQSTYVEGKILVDIASKYSTIDTDVTELSGTYETSSYTVNLSSTSEWTATTIPSWVTLSTTAGTSGVTEITVTFSKNTSYLERTGTIVFTNSESDTCEVVCTQEKYPLLIPNENIYRADLEVVKGYRSGSTINKAYRSGELIYYRLQTEEPGPTPPTPQEQPLTCEVTDAGTIVWRKAGNNAPSRTIQYSINNGSWQSITANDTAGTAINVSVGDVVQFKGNNTSYASQGSYITACRFAGTAKYYAYGNIMSLIYEDNFIGETTLTANYTFTGLFFQATGLTSTSTHKLVLPATTLTNNCYHHMFYGCSNLEMAPELPAPTLANYSYSEMFGGCSKLAYIKCLATNISATNSTYAWVNGVAATGTFETPSSTGWSTGRDGIPSGWTRVNA